MKNNLCIINCPLCNKNQSEILLRKGTELSPVNVSICRDCGFVFLNPKWNEERTEFYYRYEYDLFHRPLPLKQKIIGEETVCAREVYERISNNVELGEVKNILDVGAANGEILNYFGQKLASWENLYAIEPSIKCKRKIQENGGQIISESILIIWIFIKTK